MSHDDSDEEMYSITSSKTVYRRSRSRPSIFVRREDSQTTDFRDLPRFPRRSYSDERRPSKAYYPVTKWAVDYNNQNYIRSKCNKNKGLHRKVQGRPLDWRIDYDNNYFTRSKVNAPKGRHRKIPEQKRKYAPDNDILADATGWEFDWGPEWDQAEQDVTFIPEGRIVSRGCYRWHGARRNDSDCDLSQEETRENLLNEELERELKYGSEFLQADRPHMTEELGRRYSRGGYRFYETQRNAYDITPEELASCQHDPEWRRKHHTNGFRYLDLDIGEGDDDDYRARHATKGKPFRRTILNKVYEMRRKVSTEGPGRYGTRLTLRPGEGKKSLYEGVPDRFKSRKAPDMRDIFKMPRHSRDRYDSSGHEDEYRSELRADYADRMRRMASDRRRRSQEDEFGESSRRILADDYAYRVESPDNSEEFPEKRVRKTHSVEGRDAFDTWKDNTVHHKSEERYYSRAKPPREMKTESKRTPGYEKSDRRSSEKKYDQSDRPLQGSKSSGREKDREYKTSESKSDKQRSIEKKYDQSESPLQQSRTSGRELKEPEHKTREPKSDIRSLEKKYDQSDRPLQGSKSSGRERDLEYKIRESKSDRRSPEKKYDQSGVPLQGSKSSGREKDLEHKTSEPGKDESVKKLPPDVQKRMKQIRENIEKKMGNMDDHQRREKSGKIGSRHSLDSIDLTKHKGHPDDHGYTHDEDYEKYTTKNGSEVWVKKEESISELHHKDSR